MGQNDGEKERHERKKRMGMTVEKRWQRDHSLRTRLGNRTRPKSVREAKKGKVNSIKEALSPRDFA